MDITATTGLAINQAYLGSCIGGRYGDLVKAAQILKGRKVHPDVRFLVSAASRAIYHRALREGIIETLSDAGAMILAPSCGVCLGLHSGILAGGERAISSTNRNFVFSIAMLSMSACRCWNARMWTKFTPVMSWPLTLKPVRSLIKLLMRYINRHRWRPSNGCFECRRVDWLSGEKVRSRLSINYYGFYGAF